jgi:hypothetical protein
MINIESEEQSFKEALRFFFCIDFMLLGILKGKSNSCRVSKLIWGFVSL